MNSFLLSSSAVEEANKLLATIEGYLPKVFDFAVKIVIALVLLVVGKIIIKMILKFCDKFFTKAGVEISIKRFLESLIKVALYVILIIILCGQVGIDTASFIAVLGTLGLTVGLALQGSLSNFAGGVLIIMLKPFRVGDYIVDNGTGREGTVEKVDLFYTKLITPDNRAISIPNGSLSNSAITNVSAFDTRRVDVAFGIGYGEDVEKAKALLLDIAKNDEAVLSNPETVAVTTELAASQVTITVRAWCKSGDYWAVYSRIMENGKKVLDANGIEIPFEQLQVHIAK
ncbi:MAG: mechanosensitive ion channel [Lachnospiraceae bacterium]|nr:mechanosensitive ion channel [Lachnospiraceae bacterium]